MLDRVLSFLVALSLACLVWLYARSRDQVHTPPASARAAARPREQVVELDVPVRFLLPDDYPLRPRLRDERAGTVRLRVRGPAADEPPAVAAFIDLTRRPAEPGAKDEPLQIQLPGDCQLDPPAPRALAVELLPAATKMGVSRNPGK